MKFIKILIWISFLTSGTGVQAMICSDLLPPLTIERFWTFARLGSHGSYFVHVLRDPAHYNRQRMGFRIRQILDQELLRTAQEVGFTPEQTLAFADSGSGQHVLDEISETLVSPGPTGYRVSLRSRHEIQELLRAVLRPELIKVQSKLAKGSVQKWRERMGLNESQLETMVRARIESLFEVQRARAALTGVDLEFDAKILPFLVKPHYPIEAALLNKLVPRVDEFLDNPSSGAFKMTICRGQIKILPVRK